MRSCACVRCCLSFLDTNCLYCFIYHFSGFFPEIALLILYGLFLCLFLWDYFYFESIIKYQYIIIYFTQFQRTKSLINSLS